MAQTLSVCVSCSCGPPRTCFCVPLCITQYEAEVHQIQQAVCWLCHGDHRAVSQSKNFMLTVPANQLQFSKFTVIQQAFVLLCPNLLLHSDEGLSLTVLQPTREAAFSFCWPVGGTFTSFDLMFNWDPFILYLLLRCCWSWEPNENCLLNPCGSLPCQTGAQPQLCQLRGAYWVMPRNVSYMPPGGRLQKKSEIYPLQ